MGRIPVAPDVELYVQDLGTGPPVVFVAGFGLDHGVWDRQVRRLATAHRVVCVDQRGHGTSDAPWAGYDVPQLADDLLAALAALAITDCTLVGWSFGGQVAFRAAALAPDVVSRLVLVGSNAVRASRSDAFPFGRDPATLLGPLIALEESDRLTSRRTTIASGFAGPPSDDVLDWLIRISLQMPSWAAVACYESMLTADLMDDLARVTQPVLQIFGTADPVHSIKGAYWLSQTLADARLVELDACGHYPMFEAPEAFDAALEAFLG